MLWVTVIQNFKRLTTKISMTAIRFTKKTVWVDKEMCTHVFSSDKYMVNRFVDD